MRALSTILAVAAWPALQACGAADCGTAAYVTAGDAAAAWDADGDGTADLIERCGAGWGTFGLRRTDLGLTGLTPSPNVPSGSFEEDLEVSGLLLPGANLTFYTAHLTEGAVITTDQIGGFGLHKLDGTYAGIYASYALLEATIEVLSGPDNVPGGFEEDQPERWRLKWDALFGDPQSGAVLQEWHAEDVVDVTNGITIGDEAFPPDWTGAAL